MADKINVDQMAEAADGLRSILELATSQREVAKAMGYSGDAAEHIAITVYAALIEKSFHG